MKNRIQWTFAVLACLCASPASAIETSLIGFSTLGYAQSNQPYTFERYINNRGTIQRDSVLGVQLDVEFTDTISATLQAKLSPASQKDPAWDLIPSWAFLAWRPRDDLLIRLGKQRAPFLLYSENLDVGITYDFAHLPAEIYSMVTSSDYTGLSIAKTWSPNVGELTLDGYVGMMQADWRLYQRDNVVMPGSQPGTRFLRLGMRGEGITLTLVQDDNKYRVGIHHILGKVSNGDFLAAYRTQLSAAAWAQAFGVPQGAVSGSAYTVLPQAHVFSINMLLFTLGAEISLPKDFRLVAEYGHRKVTDIVSGVDATGGYLALLQDINQWTPYVSYSMMQSTTQALAVYQSINGSAGLKTAIPQLASTVAAINASQRIIADTYSILDQSTIALGTSYRVGLTQKIKVEWARTHVGVASSLVDAPAGGNVSNQNIDVLSFSYNVTF